MSIVNLNIIERTDRKKYPICKETQFCLTRGRKAAWQFIAFFEGKIDLPNLKTRLANEF